MSAQSRFFSMVEVVTGTAIGFGVALVAQLVLFPLYGIKVPLHTQVELVWWFTGISIARGYLVRRGFVQFHKWLHKWRENREIK